MPMNHRVKRKVISPDTALKKIQIFSIEEDRLCEVQLYMHILDILRNNRYNIHY